MRRALALALLLTATMAAGCAQPEEPQEVSMHGNGTDGNDTSVVDEPDDRAIYANVTGFDLAPVAEDLSSPLSVTTADDGSGRLFIVGKFGEIRVYRDGEVLDEPFIDVGGRIAAGGEQGLLGLAFHPDFPDTNRVFLSYTAQDGASTLAEYRVDPANPDRLDPDSERVLLQVDQPYENHNGGTVTFGPDGYLYLSLGDGGYGGDPHDHGQDPHTLLGTILRLDVDAASGNQSYGIPPDNPFAAGSEGAPEVWVYGLRNPWRYSFDPATGDLWIGDVGQGEWEEVTVLPSGEQAGANLGWAAYEGTHHFKGGADEADVVMPVTEYPHEDGRCSVTGGNVYRGSMIPPLQGTYLFADFCAGTLWGLKHVDGAWRQEVLMETDLRVAGFGEGPDGELYLVDHGGSVHKLVPGNTPVPEAFQPD